MGNKRKAMDDADDQAKRMKQVLHISREEKESFEFEPWQSYVTTDFATRNISIILHFPSNERHRLELNDVCELKVIFAFLQNNGIDPKIHALHMLYPKREYSLNDAFATLGQLQFHSQEMIHVNRKLP